MNRECETICRRWFEEVWNERRIGTIDELMKPDSVGHMEGGDVKGPEEFKKVHGEFLSAFPDLKVQIDDVVSDGETVVARWSVRGTHRGEGFGLAVSGLPVSFRGMTWLRVRDGKILEGWDNWNAGALMQTLSAGSAAALGA